ncbi:ParB/RepB/Spo0J family partition protein [Sulfurimonas paralvinellae]|uniref:ParB/RepB/Spo0J family partition protein n=1 Tax=Sulfurimonas paralvinellae TaxID=317658 RepID=A0A7M1B944_9BACT|nr:ParB/RepB/Spo0J family partition protein [Sulfurimonas paralvinellae]QOP45338.1 ParB/RepB/Spo0J family partition protein [Sulfurimonas paralvinellae]
MKTQKLGRGLDALLGEIDEAYENEGTQRDAVIAISLKDIRPNPFQPRKSFDETALAELAESIKNDGLLQPVVVTEDIDGYVLIAGERRFRASKLAKLKEIRAIVLNSDEQKMRQFALIENIQREELNSVELAEAYHELIKLHDITHEELATMIHKSRAHITNTLRLLQLSSKTQKALVEKKITAGHARVLVGLDDKEQQLMVNSIIGQKLSVRDVESMIKNMKKEDKAESSKENNEAVLDFSKLKEKLNDLGFYVKSSKNRLILEFDSQEETEEFLSHLQG